MVDGVAASQLAQAIVIDATYMYVAGNNSSNDARIEKRLLTTGALENSFDTDGVVDGGSVSNTFNTITIDGTYVYVAGITDANDWRIEKRLLTTGALCDAATCGTAFDTDGVIDGVAASQGANAIAIDTTYMYVAGYDVSFNWRIEKRMLDSGALLEGPSVDTPLAALNTVATAPAQGTPFRLRMNLHIAGNDLIQSGQSFKLQFAGKGAGTCAAPSGTPSSYTDVSNSTQIKYYDNSLSTDGGFFAVNANDPTHSSDVLKRQTYEEANDFTNSASAINIGEDGMWDFALTDNTAPEGTNYCFRAAKSDGNALNTYSQYAEIATATVTYEQSAYRWFNNQDGPSAFDGDGVVDGAAASKTPKKVVADSTYVYMVGSDDSNNFRIEKRLLTTGALCDAATCGTAFDTDGIVDGAAASQTANAIAIDSTYMYVVGYNSSVDFRIEKRLLTTGALENSFDGDGVVDGAAASNVAYAIAIDATYMYIAGDDASTNFRTEKRLLATSALISGPNVSTPLAALNTVATTPTQGTPFRLRMNLHVAGNNLAQSGQSFKLQFAGKGAGSCAAPSGTPSSYTDVTTGTAIKYYNNSLPADGDSFTANANDPTHSSDVLKRQSYEELNNFTNSTSAINLGEDGMWDFALVDDTATASTNYCFRVVKSTGTVIDTYSHYGEITTASGGGNTNPGSPTSLAQKKTDDTVLATGDWTNETSIKLTASVSDSDGGDTVKICAEVKAITVALTSPAGDGDGCSTTGVSSGGTAIVTIGGLSTNTEYHWQIKAKDASGAYSAWTGYGGNTENPPTNPAARDFGVDTTAPTIATVFDNTNTVSQPSTSDTFDNGDGSLTTLSATWNAFDATVSGLQKYEYSIGTTVGGTDIKAWTNNTTATTIRTGSLSLQTSKTYFVNVRATDNAGNVSSTASSNGQEVAPTISFDIDVSASDTETSPPYLVNFGGLAGGNVSDSPVKVWVDFTTNAKGGGRVYLTGQQAGLYSPLSNFTINAVTGDLSSLSTGFGAQGASATQSSGGPLTISTLYNVGGNNVGSADTSIRDIFSSSASITGGRGSFILKAKPSVTTPASTDYSETLTLIAAPSY